MRDGPTDEVLAGAPGWACQIDSWLDGALLANDIPILGGHITAKADQAIPEKLTFTVGRYSKPDEDSDVFDWRPGSDPTHPLARYGQQLDVTIEVTSEADVWLTRVGRFLITDWADDDAGTITVTADGLLRVVQDDKLTAVTSPSGTFMSEVQRLLPAGLGVSFDPALVDRAVPTSMSWSEDRLEALQEIADAWPALLRTDEWGQVTFTPPLPSAPVPVLTLKDGVGGTLILAPRSDTRTEAYNMVVATSSASGREDVFGVAQVTSGPMNVTGPYFPVVKRWASPLIQNKAEATAAAQTMLANSTRPAQSVPISIAPDPRIELDDAVQVLRGAQGSMQTTTTTSGSGTYIADVADAGTFIHS